MQERGQRARDVGNGHCHPVLMTWSLHHPPSVFFFFFFLEHI